MINCTWHILLVALAGWMNRQQQEVIEYLKEENRVLREKLGPLHPNPTEPSPFDRPNRIGDPGGRARH